MASDFGFSPLNKIADLTADLQGSRLAEIAPVNQHEFSLFRDLIYQQVGIHLSPEKALLLKSRLGVRLVHHGHRSLLDYYLQLINDAEELQVCIDLITTNETYFFREMAHFDYFKQELLPQVSHKALRVWSAACASGEETYSLAMLLADAAKNQDWELIGSDISQGMLQKAATGHYQMLRHEGIPQEYLKRYCLRGTDSHAGTLLINRALCERVRFCQVNLNALLVSMGQFDVIFLRNVLIYFSQDKKADIVKRILQQLKPGGYFFISHTESLQGINVDVKMIRPSIFQKQK